MVKQIYLQVFDILLRILNTESLGQSLAACSPAGADCSAASNTLHARYQHVVAQLSRPNLGGMDVDGSEEHRAVEAFESEIDDTDRCAACSEIIGFDKLGRATCRNGHEWCAYSLTTTSGLG